MQESVKKDSQGSGVIFYLLIGTLGLSLIGAFAFIIYSMFSEL